MRIFLLLISSLLFAEDAVAPIPPIPAAKKLEIRDAQVALLNLQVQYAKLPGQIQEASQTYVKLINDTRPKGCDNCSFSEQLLQWVKP